MTGFTRNNQRAISLIQTARCMIAVPDFDLSVEPNNSERSMLHIWIQEVQLRQNNSGVNGIALKRNSNIFEYLYGIECPLCLK